MKHTTYCIILLVFFQACKPSSTANKSTAAKQEILVAEKEFEALVKKEGVTKGFTEYAAEDAVINRGDSLVKTKAGIQNYYASKKPTNSQLVWTADFADAAASGDIGYTYGHYTYTLTDSTGKPTVYTGVFQTVWKKQKDGEWRFVWD